MQGLEAVVGKLEPELKEILREHRIPPQAAGALLHETLLILVSKAASIRDPEAWLKTTLAARCAGYWRHQRNRLWAQVDAAVQNLLNDAAAPLAEREEFRDSIEALLCQLPDPCRCQLRRRYGLDSSDEGQRTSAGEEPAHDCLAALGRLLLGARRISSI